MRVPGDVSPRSVRTRHRRRWWILVVVILVVILLASLRTLATVYTDALWFDSIDQHAVWVRLLEVKLGLFASFGAIFFVLAWVNLVVADRLSVASASTPSDPEDELVRRYQRAVRPYAGWVYWILALAMALVAATGSIGEWQNWILFTHSVSFGVTDPQFHRDVGFFVFKLPFLSFVIDWALISLAVVTVVVAVFHYLNGGIRPQNRTQRVRPAVKAHLSVLLALIAIVKAAGYVVATFQLDVSNNGYVEGAGYTDVHARLPALEVLFWVSLAAAAILLFNIRRQGWTLPVLAVGVWAFVALVIGVIYPAVLQAVRVNPAQATQERPYISRNIDATRAAYDIGPDNLTTTKYTGNAPVSESALESQRPDAEKHPSVGSRHRRADRAEAAEQADLLPDPHPRHGPLRHRQHPHAGHDRGPSGQHLQPARGLPDLGQHPPRLHPRRGHGHRSVQPGQRLGSPQLRDQRGAPDLDGRLAKDHPARRLLRAQPAGLGRGRHQIPRDRLPDDQRHQRDQPLLGIRRCAADLVPQAGGLRHPAGRLQPAGLEPDHLRVPDHVRPGHQGDGAEGGAVPHLRQRSLPGPRGWAHRLGAQRLHHHEPVPLLGGRQLL